MVAGSGSGYARHNGCGWFWRQAYFEAQSQARKDATKEEKLAKKEANAVLVHHAQEVHMCMHAALDQLPDIEPPPPTTVPPAPSVLEGVVGCCTDLGDRFN